jgi:hypothetical protein
MKMALARAAFEQRLAVVAEGQGSEPSVADAARRHVRRGYVAACNRGCCQLYQLASKSRSIFASAFIEAMTGVQANHACT